MRRSGGVGIALFFMACTAPPAPDPWTLSTIDTLEANKDPAVVDPGAGLRLLQSPFPLVGSQTGVEQTSQRGLTIFPAFSEGKTAAYMTTEIWENFDEVWVQPLYVDTTRQNLPVFGVDSSTRFYSPYWQIFTYQLPPGASFRSAKDVLDSQVQLTPNSAKFCSITRDATLLAALQQGDVTPVRPLTGEPVGAPKNGKALADGHTVWFIDLGNAQRFTFNAAQEVEETPLFAFALPDASGNPLEIADLPKVGGSGPLHSPRCDGAGNCTGVAGGVPEFGSLWRVYDVLLPATADVYVPSGNTALQAAAQAMGFKAAATAADFPPAFILRVAINGKTCLPGATDQKSCQWLDSQNAIEAAVPDWRITETGRLVTCPLLLFNGKALGAP